MAVSTSRPRVQDNTVLPRFTRSGMVDVPKDRLPDGAMLPQTAYQIVLDEVMLDGNARFNLATFVTTWMDEEADKLYAATVDKNMVDKDEYPQTAEIEARCVRMLGDLWHVPDAVDSVGTSTTGSSEGCMLAGLALKRRWQQARRAAGKDTDRPNIVMGGNVQVVWEKFANYWEVEPRYVPLEGDVFHLTADRLLDHVDENTIGVVAVLGSTMDGTYEPVQEICAALDGYETDSGVSVSTSCSRPTRSGSSPAMASCLPSSQRWLRSSSSAGTWPAASPTSGAITARRTACWPSPARAAGSARPATRRRSSSSGRCWPRASSIRCRTGISCSASPRCSARTFRCDRDLLKDLCRLAHECLIEFLRTSLGLPAGVPGIVMAIHTFGKYLDFHPACTRWWPTGCLRVRGSST